MILAALRLLAAASLASAFAWAAFGIRWWAADESIGEIRIFFLVLFHVAPWIAIAFLSTFREEST